MSRMGYREALVWLVMNDDCTYLEDPESVRGLSVAASFAADIYGKDDDTVREDLIRTRKKMYPRSRSYAR